MKRGIKLNNVIFPIWLLWLVPTVWIAVLPANFLIDCAVTAAALKYLKIGGIKDRVKSVILKVWIFGFIADFIGTFFMFSVNFIDDFLADNKAFQKWWYENLTSAVSYNPFKSAYSILWTAACVLISAFFIYIFNYRICLKKLDIEKWQKKKIALFMAVLTAPYFFLVPTAWFF